MLVAVCMTAAVVGQATWDLELGCFDLDTSTASAASAGQCDADAELLIQRIGIPAVDYAMADAKGDVSLCVWRAPASFPGGLGAMPDELPDSNNCDNGNSAFIGYVSRLGNHLDNKPVYWRNAAEPEKSFKIWVTRLGLVTETNTISYAPFGAALSPVPPPAPTPAPLPPPTPAPPSASPAPPTPVTPVVPVTPATPAPVSTPVQPPATGATLPPVAPATPVPAPTGPLVEGDEVCSSYVWHDTYSVFMHAIIGATPAETEISITIRSSRTSWFGLGMSAYRIMAGSWAIVYSDRGAEEYILGEHKPGEHVTPDFDTVAEEGAVMVLKKIRKVKEPYHEFPDVEWGGEFGIIVACGQCFDSANDTMQLVHHGYRSREYQRMRWGNVACSAEVPVPTQAGAGEEDLEDEGGWEWWHFLLVSVGGVCVLFLIAIAVVIVRGKRKRKRAAGQLEEIGGKKEDEAMAKPLIEDEKEDPQDNASNSNLSAASEMVLRERDDNSSMSSINDDWAPLKRPEKPLPAIPADLIMKEGNAMVSPFDDPQLAELKREYQRNANQLTMYRDKNTQLRTMLTEIEDMVAEQRVKKKLPTAPPGSIGMDEL